MGQDTEIDWLRTTKTEIAKSTQTDCLDSSDEAQNMQQETVSPRVLNDPTFRAIMKKSNTSEDKHPINRSLQDFGATFLIGKTAESIIGIGSGSLDMRKIDETLNLI